MIHSQIEYKQARSDCRWGELHGMLQYSGVTYPTPLGVDPTKAGIDPTKRGDSYAKDIRTQDS